jgi:GH15 family glucan-1,4-alpha-glucosidase
MSDYHGFPPIADYAFLSDCQTMALVSPGGSVEWLCLPRPDSPSIFGAALDRSAGQFRVGPQDVHVPIGRRYLPGTMLLETTWQTGTGWLSVTDFLSMVPWYLDRSRSVGHRRVPNDYDSQHCFVRLMKCAHGTVDIAVDCEPAFDYGQRDAQWTYADEGYGLAITTGDAMTLGIEQSIRLLLKTSLRLGFEGRRAHARTTLHEGDTAFVILSWGGAHLPDLFDEVVSIQNRTAAFWLSWLRRGSFPDHPWRTALQRSALTLKGLTYAPTGALIAAATTSLPEAPQGERNWDYRYSWVRDSTFALWGLYALGFENEADDFFYFIADVCEQNNELQIMYGVGGERELPESILKHLVGYDGAAPVRVGNAAYCQAQHDVWGAVLDSVYLHVRSRDQLSERIWPVLVRQVDAALNHWREPDCGIWEVRGARRHFTSSKLMCWVAADRGSRLAALRQDYDREKAWRSAADAIAEDILQNGVDKRGVFTQYYGGTALDASLLLMPLFRFLPPDDARIQATVRAIQNDLTVDGFVRRYRVDETDDGLEGAEGTFLICSFWLASALVEIGDTQAAKELCERLLRAASDLGLYGEELDPRTGRHWGNFPQAFTHLALINAVMHVIHAQRSGKGDAPSKLDYFEERD